MCASMPGGRFARLGSMRTRPAGGADAGPPGGRAAGGGWTSHPSACPAGSTGSPPATGSTRPWGTAPAAADGTVRLVATRRRGRRCSPRRPGAPCRRTSTSFVTVAQQARRLGPAAGPAGLGRRRHRGRRAAGGVQGGHVLRAEPYGGRRLVAAALRPAPLQPGQGGRGGCRRPRRTPAAAGRSTVWPPWSPAATGAPSRRSWPTTAWRPVAARRADRFLDVAEPRLAVLQAAVEAARAVRIVIHDAGPPS